ncbi:MAG: dihydropteroate synthase [Ehrlichia sp.]
MGTSFFTVDKALKQVEHLIDGGTDIIDVGAESGKPKYIYESDETLITQEEEWKRLECILPKIIEIAHSRNVQVSIDTRNAKTAEKALELNADIINDCTALADPKMIPVLKNSNAKIIVVHNLGVPLIKGNFIAKGKNPITEIKSYLENCTKKTNR